MSTIKQPSNGTPPAASAAAAASRAVVALLFLVAAGAAATAGWHWTFTGFREFDDEGYVLLTLRRVLQGGVLYDQVYSQYGSAYYAVQGATVRLLGLPVTHDALRAVTLAHWMLTSLLAGGAVWRLARSPLAGVVAFLSTFFCLRVCAWEPTHPQALSALCLSGAVFAGSFLGAGHTGRTRRTGRVAAFAFGALAAVLLLIKVNLGVFLLVAVGIAGFAVARPSPLTRAGFWASASAAIALPIVLMRAQLTEPWAAVFCVLLLATIGMVVFAAYRNETVAVWDRGATLAAVGGFLGTAVALCVGTLTAGTTPAGLLRGLLLQHLGFEQAFLLPVPMKIPAVILPAVCLFVAYYALSGGGGRRAGMADSLLIFAKFAFGLLTLWIVLTAEPGAEPNAVLPSYVPISAYVWLGAVRPAALGDDPERLRAGRLLLTAAAAIEVLWMYPVAGSQLNCGLFLPMCVAALCLGDGVRAVSARLSGAAALRVEALSGVLITLAVAFYCWACSSTARAAYRAAVPLDLPGTRLVRVEAKRAAELRDLTTRLAGSPDTFFTYPGMNSLYFWAEKEPPTDLNTTAWMTLFDEEQQRKVVGQLAGHPGLVVVYNGQMERFWLRGSDVSGRPLVAYIRGEFVPYDEIGPFVLTRRR